MEMTIDEAIDLFEDNFTVIDTHGHYTEKEEIQAIVTAIETMRKYQQIEQILDDCDLEAWEVLEKIKEVVANGRN